MRLLYMRFGLTRDDSEETAAAVSELGDTADTSNVSAYKRG